MNVIILAGGKGTRLPDSAKDIPKALVEVKRKPVLLWQIEYLEKYGIVESDIRLALGHRAEKVVEFLKENQLKCKYLTEKEPLGTGGAIKFASKDLKEDFLTISCDILCDINLNDFVKVHKDLKSKATIAAFECGDVSSYGLLDVQGNVVKNFLEKPSFSSAGLINAGVYIFSPNVFSDVPKKTFSIERDFFPNLAAQGKLSAFIHSGKWIDVGTEERLSWARENFFKV